MDISVLIPTYRRARELGNCLRALAGQRLGADRFEVLVGFDGPDPAGVTGARAAWGGGAPGVLKIVECPRGGYTAVRRRLLEEARGEILVSLNDDVVPAPEFLSVHLEAQRGAMESGRPAVVVGDSPWKVHEEDTLFDRLVRETTMVFFYPAMCGAKRGPEHDWGYRHCFGLNFSAPMDAVREVGGFRDFPFTYGYDDIELGFKLGARFGMPVRFCPRAVAVHDHRYGPGDMLKREYSLGRAAWLFAGANPEFGLALFGRDIRGAEELEYSRAFLVRERSGAAMVQREFLRLGEIPAAAVGGEHGAGVLTALAQQFTLLKRYIWRQGLLDAAASVPAEGRPVGALDDGPRS